MKRSRNGGEEEKEIKRGRSVNQQLENYLQKHRQIQRVQGYDIYVHSNPDVVFERNNVKYHLNRWSLFQWLKSLGSSITYPLIYQTDFLLANNDASLTSGLLLNERDVSFILSTD